MYPYIEDELNKEEVLDELSDIKKEIIKKHKSRKQHFQIHIFDLEKICKSINVNGKVFMSKAKSWGSNEKMIKGIGRITTRGNVILTTKLSTLTKHIDKNFNICTGTNISDKGKELLKNSNIIPSETVYFFSPCLIIQPLMKDSKTLTFMKMNKLFNKFKDYGSILFLSKTKNMNLNMHLLVDNFVEYKYENKSTRRRIT